MCGEVRSQNLEQIATLRENQKRKLWLSVLLFELHNICGRTFSIENAKDPKLTIMLSSTAKLTADTHMLSERQQTKFQKPKACARKLPGIQ